MDIVQNLRDALNGKEVEKIPAVSPTTAGVYEAFEKAHAAYPEVHTDVDQMVRLALSLHEQVGLESARVPFCLTGEAEVFGCKVDLGDRDNPPKIIDTAHLEDPGELDVPDDYPNQGRLALMLDAVEILKNEHPDVPIVMGILGPFTLTGYILGVENMEKMLKLDINDVMDVVDVVEDAQEELCSAIHDAGADLIDVADPTSSPDLLDPFDFFEISHPFLEDLSSSMKTQGILHICGNTEPILKGMLTAGFDGASVEEVIDMREAQKIRKDIGASTVMVGNVSTSETLFNKSPDDVKAEVKRALERGTNVLAPSCGIALKSPLENIRAFVVGRDEYYE